MASEESGMRYFFHLREPGAFLADEEGLELSDLNAVKIAAIAGARSIIAGDAMAGRCRSARSWKW